MSFLKLMAVATWALAGRSTPRGFNTFLPGTIRTWAKRFWLYYKNWSRLLDQYAASFPGFPGGPLWLHLCFRLFIFILKAHLEDLLRHHYQPFLKGQNVEFFFCIFFSMSNVEFFFSMSSYLPARPGGPKRHKTS